MRNQLCKSAGRGGKVFEAVGKDAGVGKEIVPLEFREGEVQDT